MGTSLTQQVVDRFAAAIEAGELEPGEKLPPTRELAELVGVNHLTAARVYRRLAELGFVTASVGRGTFVRTLAPAGSAELGDDWQLYALPEHELSYSEQVLADAMASGGQPDLISLAVGWPSPALYPTAELSRASPPRCSPRRATRRCPTSRPRASTRCASSWRRAGAGTGSPTTRTRSSSPPAPSRGSASRRGRRSSRATWRSSSRPPSPDCSTRSVQTGARVIGVPVDEDGFDVGRSSACWRATRSSWSPSRPPRRTPPGATSPSAARLAGSRWSATSSCSRTACTRTRRSAATRAPSVRGLAPGHVIYVNSLSKVVGGGLRTGWVAARGPVRERIAMLKLESDFHSATLIQHIARWLATGAYDKHVEQTQPFYRERRDALLAALERHMPGSTWPIRPRADITSGSRSRARSTTARSTPRRRATAWRSSPATRSPPSAVRRRPSGSFSLLDPPELDEGVRRLARAIRELRRRSRHAVAAPMS